MILNMSGGGTLPTPEEIGALSMELLWENASPKSTFPEQTVSLDLSSYDSVAIDFLNFSGGDSHIIEKNNVGSSFWAFYFTSTSECQQWSRESSPTSGGVKFGESKLIMLRDGTVIQANTYMIPQRIYGIKGVSA